MCHIVRGQFNNRGNTQGKMMQTVNIHTNKGAMTNGVTIRDTFGNGNVHNRRCDNTIMGWFKTGSEGWGGYKS